MQNGLVRLARSLVPSIRLNDKPRGEPEAVNARPRPMTGLFANLTPQQQKAALAYRGAENHGSSDYLLK